MKLTLGERFEVLRLLPEQGNFATLKIIGETRSNLAPSEADYKKFDIRQQGDQFIWDSAKGAEEVEILIGDVASDIIAKSLKAMDEAEILGIQHISLYEKFVE